MYCHMIFILCKPCNLENDRIFFDFPQKRSTCCDQVDEFSFSEDIQHDCGSEVKPVSAQKTLSLSL